MPFPEKGYSCIWILDSPGLAAFGCRVLVWAVTELRGFVSDAAQHLRAFQVLAISSWVFSPHGFGFFPPMVLAFCLFLDVLRIVTGRRELLQAPQPVIRSS